MRICERCGYESIFSPDKKYCVFCEKIIEKEHTQKLIREGAEYVDTTSDSYVFCPNCGHSINTNYTQEDFPEIYEDGTHSLTCPECDQDFFLETHVMYTYKTFKNVGNKKYIQYGKGVCVS